MAAAAVRRQDDLQLAHHRYRIDHGIYPDTIVSVVNELLDEIERVRLQRDGIDVAFREWRVRAYEEARTMADLAAAYPPAEPT